MGTSCRLFVFSWRALLLASGNLEHELAHGFAPWNAWILAHGSCLLSNAPAPAAVHSLACVLVMRHHSFLRQLLAQCATKLNRLSGWCTWSFSCHLARVSNLADVPPHIAWLFTSCICLLLNAPSPAVPPTLACSAALRHFHCKGFLPIARASFKVLMRTRAHSSRSMRAALAHLHGMACAHAVRGPVRTLLRPFGFTFVL